MTPDFRELAKTWPVWESATHMPPLIDDKVRFRYDGDYGSERILVVSGRATVIPDDGSPPVTIGPGDSICSIETDKATVDFEATDDGVLAKLLVEEGATDIDIGTPILVRHLTFLSIFFRLYFHVSF